VHCYHNNVSDVIDINVKVKTMFNYRFIGLFHASCSLNPRE
jgi:hypothetical protein